MEQVPKSKTIIRLQHLTILFLMMKLSNWTVKQVLKWSPKKRI